MQNTLHTLLALASLASAAVAPTNCNANNCLRQVRATAFTTRPTAADCSAYQTTTVTATTTVATTTVFTTTSAAGNTQQTPELVRTIPAYASNCAKEAEYRSACSCIGSTTAIITAASTVSVTATKVCTTAVLQAIDGPDQGKYFVDKDDYGGPLQRVRGLTLESATRYEYRNGRFYRPGSDVDLLYGFPFSAGTLGLGNYYTTQLSPADAQYQAYPLNCAIAPITNQLTCKTEVGDANIFSVNPNDPLHFIFFKSLQEQDEYSTPFNVRAVPVCPA